MAFLKKNNELTELKEENEKLKTSLKELSMLNELSTLISSTLSLKKIMDRVVDESVKAIKAEQGTIHLLDKKRSDDDLDPFKTFIRRADQTIPTNKFRLDQEVSGWMMINRKPLMVNDFENNKQFLNREAGNLKIRSLLTVPLLCKGNLIGVLNLFNKKGTGGFTENDQRLLSIIASQSAQVIENARLYEQARHFAALEERQKLARELHDSVSQALYGIVLGARTARTLLDRDPAQATQPLDYILSLSEAGLAEMRALIFELRPESLQTEGLAAALGKLVNALGARAQLEIRLEAGEESEAPIEVKESLYRIAQEALNNIAKHARATHVEVELANQDGHLLLNISDDGIGFDPTQNYPGHLGMHTMRERAESAGGTFAIESAPNAGTRIQVTIPLTAR